MGFFNLGQGWGVTATRFFQVLHVKIFATFFSSSLAIHPRDRQKTTAEKHRILLSYLSVLWIYLQEVNHLFELHLSVKSVLIKMFGRMQYQNGHVDRSLLFILQILGMYGAM